MREKERRRGKGSTTISATPTTDAATAIITTLLTTKVGLMKTKGLIQNFEIKKRKEGGKEG